MSRTSLWHILRHGPVSGGMLSAFAKNVFGDAITVLHKADDSVENETQSKFATLQNRLIDLMNEFVHDAPLSIMEFHLRTNIHMIFGAEENYLILKPLFKKALTDTTISAWITENEAGALCAYYFLNIDTQIPREKQPTLIFFDNDRRLASYNVSNYNFSFASIVEKALTYILNPRHEYYWNKTRIECEGFFVERGNMAAAR